MKGLSNKDIAVQLDINETTIKWHLTDIYKICEVKSRFELMAKIHREKVDYDSCKQFLKELAYESTPLGK